MILTQLCSRQCGSCEGYLWSSHKQRSIHPARSTCSQRTRSMRSRGPRNPCHCTACGIVEQRSDCPKESTLKYKQYLTLQRCSWLPAKQGPLKWCTGCSGWRWCRCSPDCWMAHRWSPYSERCSPRTYCTPCP